MGKIYKDIVETVGRTPLVKLNKVTEGLHATILLKCEFFNPLGSVKDRIGLAMIEAAEKARQNQQGHRHRRATRGNTGIALAFVAAAKGYKLILTMPETMSLERRTLLAMLGAKLVLTPGAEGMKGAIAKRRSELHEETPNAWIPQQFDNPANPEIHATPPPRKSGTTPTARWTSSSRPSAPAAPSPASPKSSSRANRPSWRSPWSPKDSPVITQTLTGEPLKPGPHKIQGLGAGFIPQESPSEG